MKLDLRVMTGLIFGAVVALFMGLGIKWPLLTVLFLVLIACVCSLEYYHAMKKRFKKLSLVEMFIGTGMVITPLIAWLAYPKLRLGWHMITKRGPQIDQYWPTDFIWLTGIGLGIFLIISGLVVLFMLLYHILRQGPESIPMTFINLSTIPMIAFPFAFGILYMFAVPNGWRWLLFALVTPWITDISAYYTGRYLGKNTILPKLSPNKTLEGSLGGLAGGVVFGILYFLIMMYGVEPLHSHAGTIILYGLISGLLISVVSQCGDWVASGIKRMSNIKDFSHFLPGHGGFMDRFDSVLFSLPISFVICICYYLI